MNRGCTMAQISVKIEKKKKKEAQDILASYGVDISTGIRMYFKAIVRSNGIPLELRPMTELDEANYEADNHIYHGSYSSFEEYKKAMRK